MNMSEKDKTEYAIRSGLPRRHVEKITNGGDIEDNVQKCYDKILPLLIDRNTVLIRGDYGSGKTHMACLIGFDWPGKGRGGVRYQTVCGLLIELKASFSQKGAENPLVKSMNCGLLILDELLKDAGSVFDQNTIRELVDSRYRNMKPTIILTNLDDAGLLQSLDHPTIDRMFDGGCVVELTGKSQRTKGTK